MSNRKHHPRKNSDHTSQHSRKQSCDDTGMYKIVAEDPTLARFLKYSKNHYQEFQEYMSAISKAEIVEDGNQKIVYECVQGGALDLNNKTFEKICDKRIQTFLENYKTVKQDFDHDSLVHEVAKDPVYFAEQSKFADYNLFVRWRINQNRVIVSGPKDMVDEKIKEIYHRVNVTSGKRARRKSSQSSDEIRGHIFKLVAPDPSVARFINGSNREQQKFQDYMKDVSTASVQKQDNGTIELECRSIKGSKLSNLEFKKLCNMRVVEFLSKYTTKKKCFEKDFLNWAYTKYPDFFQQQSKAEDRVLFVRWHRDTNTVLITGPKDDVERKMDEILRFLNPPVNSIYDPKEGKKDSNSFPTSPRRSNGKVKYFRRAQSATVARFIKQSRIHQKRMYSHLNPLAFVTIVEQEDGSMEFDCSPYKGLEINSGDFRRQVNKMLDEFLVDYKTRTYNFDRSAIERMKIDDPGFFDRQTKINPEYFIIRWRLDKCEVEITGHMNDVLLKYRELDDIFHSLAASGLPRNSSQGNVAQDNLMFEYYPKAQYKELLLKVLHSPDIRRSFEKSCKKLCTIKKSGIPIQVFPVKTSQPFNRNAFMNQYITLFEGFLDNMMSATVKIEPNVAKMLKEKFKPQWIKEAEENKNKNFTLKWVSDGISLFGESKEVGKWRKIFEENLKVSKDEMDVDSSICRILQKCEVLKTINTKFNGLVKLSCPTGRPVTIFEGISGFIDLAKADVGAMDLVEQPPNISQEKFDYLRKIFSDPGYVKQENKIHALLDNCGIKATLVLRLRELLVVAATQKDFETCCHRLNKVILVQSVAVPTGLSIVKVMTSNAYAQLEAKHHVLVKGKNLDIVAIEAKGIKKAIEALQQLFEVYTGVSSHKDPDRLDYNQNIESKMTELSLTKNKNAPVPKKRSKVSLGVVFPDKPGVSGVSQKPSTKSYGKLSVEVKVGDIVHEKCDMIFNGVNNSFNLSKGTVTAAILKAAGPKIDQQCKNGPLLANPFLRITDGFNLKCNYVLHMVTPSKANELEDKLVMALKCAKDFQVVTSVAIPTLGAGAVGLSVQSVASLMSRAFKTFSKEKPIREMKIIVVVFDPNILNDFEKEISGGD